MAARSIATATISFGLVTVPVRIYPAVRQSAGLSFHLLHAKDKVRLKQQYVCPEDEEIVPRSEMVKGFEYKKGQYVVFTDAELKALDEKATNGLEITEFLPKDAVDPVYFEKTYYLGADKGGEKGYSLLAQAMATADEIALAKYAARGKSYLVLIRSTGDRLFMQQLQLTPTAFWNYRRIQSAQTALLGSEESIKSIAYSHGFSSPETFTRWFGQQRGLSPKQYRRIFLK